MLDIIMPHYDEPWSTGKPFFDMLGAQRMVDFRKIRVILVHDGTSVFDRKIFAEYPFEVDQYRIEHRGVAAARNFGLRKAEAEWVTFCDFDDLYTDVYALKMITDTFGQNDFDLLWNPIIMEDYNHGEFRIYPLDRFNMIFIHNKYFRREFLMKTGLWFNESLSYAEDSAFLAILNVMLGEKRVGEIKSLSPLYAWTYRIGSVTTNPANRPKNVRQLFEANKYISAEFERLHYKDAALMKFRTVTDAYFGLTGEDAPDCGDLKQEVLAYWKANRKEIGTKSRKDLDRVYRSSMKSGRRGRPETTRPSLADWLKEGSDD